MLTRTDVPRTWSDLPVTGFLSTMRSRRAVRSLYPAGIGDGHGLVAAGGDRLQVLVAHDRAHAAAARGPVPVVHDGGEQDPVFAGRADAGHRGFGREFRPGWPSGSAGCPAPRRPTRRGFRPRRRGPTDRRAWRPGRAMTSPSRPAPLSAAPNCPAGARIADGPGQGRARDDLVAARGHHRPGQRPGHEDQGVVFGRRDRSEPGRGRYTA